MSNIESDPGTWLVKARGQREGFLSNFPKVFGRRFFGRDLYSVFSLEEDPKGTTTRVPLWSGLARDSHAAVDEARKSLRNLHKGIGGDNSDFGKPDNTSTNISRFALIAGGFGLGIYYLINKQPEQALYPALISLTAISLLRGRERFSQYGS